MKKNLYRAALLAALGLASVSSANAQANGDLIAGFTTGSGNDVIVDLGAAGSLYDGQFWSSGTLGISGTAFTWGVIGDSYNGAAANGLSPNTVWTTTLGTPNQIASGVFNSIDIGISTIFNNGDTQITGAGSYTQDAATQPSWQYQTVSGALSTTYHNAYLNPNTSGAAVIDLYTITADSTAPVLDGYFTLSSSGLTFNVAPVPEPSSCALFGAAGMLVLVMRNKFRRNVA